MIAILTTEKQATELSNKIHEYLTKNRKGYSAARWSDLNKSDNAELWAVKIPKDYTYEGETVEQLPKDWRNEEPL